MAEKNANLLVGDEAAPVAGVNYDSLVPWYGGELSVNASGVFDGAGLSLVCCTKLPKLGEGETYADVLTEDDWVELHAFTENGRFQDNINPCLLGVRVNVPGANTRTRVIVS